MVESVKEFIYSSVIPFLSVWGYLIIAVAAMVESVPFLGILVPGGTIVILGGVFAGEAGLSIPCLIVSAAIGAFIGDCISFGVGKRYGEGILMKYGPHIGFKDEYLFVTRRLCIQYGGWALIIGRFNQIARPFIPLAVGATPFPYYKFWFFAILGGTIWSIFSVLIGKFARESWEVIQGTVGLIGGSIFLIIIIAVILVVRYEVKKIKSKKIYKIRNEFRKKIRRNAWTKKLREMKEKRAERKRIKKELKNF